MHLTRIYPYLIGFLPIIYALKTALTEYGLLHWCYNFFADTQRFTINYPNRHMIGHGRWDDEISEEEFLKLFNVLLYLEENFDYWAGIIDENC